MAGKLSEKIEEMYRNSRNLRDELNSMINMCTQRLAFLIREMLKDVSGVDISVKLAITAIAGEYDERKKDITISVNKNHNISYVIVSALHEARHAIQHMSLGDRFHDEYFKAGIEYGYSRNPFQLDALRYSIEKFPEAVEWMRKRIGEKLLYNELNSVYICVHDSVSKMLDSLIKIEDNYWYWIRNRKRHVRLVLRNMKHFMGIATEYFKVVKSCCDKMNELLKNIATV